MLRLLLWCGFDPWPSNFHVGVAKEKKKEINECQCKTNYNGKK